MGFLIVLSFFFLWQIIFSQVGPTRAAGGTSRPRNLTELISFQAFKACEGDRVTSAAAASIKTGIISPVET